LKTGSRDDTLISGKVMCSAVHICDLNALVILQIYEFSYESVYSHLRSTNTLRYSHLRLKNIQFKHRVC